MAGVRRSDCGGVSGAPIRGTGGAPQAVYACSAPCSRWDRTAAGIFLVSIAKWQRKGREMSEMSKQNDGSLTMSELEEMKKWDEIEQRFLNDWMNRDFIRYLHDRQDTSKQEKQS